MLVSPLPVSEKVQKKVDIVLKELKIDPAELIPTQRVVEQYHEIISEILKMFALQKYIKKKKEELETIHESKKEKQIFNKVLNKIPQQPPMMPPQQYQQVPPSQLNPMQQPIAPGSNVPPQ